MHSGPAASLLLESGPEVRDLISIVGEDGLNLDQIALLKFGENFENKFINQGATENRDFNQTFKIIWDILSELPHSALFRIHQKYIDKYYHGVM